MRLIDFKATLRSEFADRISIDDIFLHECQIIISHYLEISREEYFFNSDTTILSQKQVEYLLKLISRRVSGEPVSHIINNRQFYGLDFYVDSNVLDPRPDSEILVAETIAIAKYLDKDLSMLELGVGSGCLSIAITLNCNNIKKVTACDINPKSLEVCKKNVYNHGLVDRFNLSESDLFLNISNDNKFDIIISNPPYIKSKDIEKLQIEVKDHEPIVALDGGEDGLDFYRKISFEAKNYLGKAGNLIFEIGFDQKHDVVKILENHNYEIVKCCQDLAANDRVIIAKPKLI